MRHLMMATILTALTLAAATTDDAKEKGQFLPDAAQVKSVFIKFDQPKGPTVEFAATAADWKAIRTALLPAEADPNPANWEWIATVKIVLKDDKPFRVELYTPSKAPGAFAAGATYKQRIYYRGGDTKEMVKALAEAYEKAFKKEE